MKHFFTCCILIVVSFCFYNNSYAQQQHRWQLNSSRGITWNIKPKDAHNDHIEMSGKFISAFLRYGVTDDQRFQLTRTLVWPMLRTIPNNTHASLIRSFSIDPVNMLTVNKREAGAEKVCEIIIDGKLTVKSAFNNGLNVVRTLFPSTDLLVFIEKYELINKSSKKLVIKVPNIHIAYNTHAADGVDGAYTLTVQSQQHGTYMLEPMQHLVFLSYV